MIAKPTLKDSCLKDTTFANESLEPILGTPIFSTFKIHSEFMQSPKNTF